MATFLAPARKVCFVAVPKVASTTFEWLVADLGELRPERFHRTLTSEPTREQTVHAAGQWPRHLRVPRPSRAAAEATGVDSSWFVFSVVRDPRERLWSAWQSKLLLRRRRYVNDYGGEPWFPGIPRGSSDVVDDFTRFVEALVDGKAGLMSNDAHFRPQAHTVLDGPFEVANLYDVRDIGTLQTDLAAHLESYGVQVPDLHRDNTTPLRIAAEVLDRGVGEAIMDLYSDDFDRLGHLWPDEPRTVPLESWSAAAFADLSSRIALHERVEDLSALARDLKAQRASLIQDTAQT